MEDLIEDEDLDFNDAEEDDEVLGPVEETPLPQTANPEIDPDLTRKAEEKERKRWQTEAAEEHVCEAALRAREKERLADAEGREARLVPLMEPDPFAGRDKPAVPRIAKPAAKIARCYESHTNPLDNAETELTAVIAECRYFMREMAFESARSLAETSPKVGHSVATVRNPALIPPEEKKTRARR